MKSFVKRDSYEVISFEILYENRWKLLKFVFTVLQR